MPSIVPVAAVVLAAGGSTRMGSPKQLLRVDGQSLLRRAAQVAVDAGCRPVAVVLGRDAGILRAELTPLAVAMVENPDWSLGMGGSIRVGVGSLLPFAPAGILVTLCDQPHVDAAALAPLMEAYARTGRTVAARYAGTVGVPAIFAPSHYHALATLDPAAGAKRLLAGPDVVPVDLPAAAVDVDTPADYERLLRERPS